MWPSNTGACPCAARSASYRAVRAAASGPPEVPWLEPDVVDHLEDLAARGTEADQTVHDEAAGRF